VLTLLVLRAGHLVSKDEFHATLWPRQVVSATSNKYIWQLRQTLEKDIGEGDEDPIETGAIACARRCNCCKPSPAFRNAQVERTEREIA